MIIVAGSRKSGKTHALIHIAKESDGYLIVGTPREARRVFEEARSHGTPIRYPLTYSEFLNKEYYGKNITQFHIDNVDHFLQYISPTVPVTAISLSGATEHLG